MTIKVYGSKQSTCTQRVVLALHEKEIFDYELVTVDLQKGEQKRPEFLQLQVTRRILLLWYHQHIAFKIDISTEIFLSHSPLHVVMFCSGCYRSFRLHAHAMCNLSSETCIYVVDQDRHNYSSLHTSHNLMIYIIQLAHELQILLHAAFWKNSSVPGWRSDALRYVHKHHCKSVELQF